MSQTTNEVHAENNGPRVSASQLKEFLIRLLVRKGMYQVDAAIAADRMVEADLRGLSYWGSFRIPRYLEAMDLGDIDPRAAVLKVRETPALVVLDAGKGLGPIAATRGMEMAVTKAREVGMATVIVKKGQELGSPALYALLAAGQGMIGYCSTSGGPAELTPSWSSKPLFARNGMAWAIPLRNREPLVIERVSRAEEIADEGAFHNSCSHPGPGFDMSLLCSILPGVLAGGRTALHKSSSPERQGSEHLFSVITPDLVLERDQFDTEVASSLEEIQAAAHSDGESQLLFPGESEARLQSKRMLEGIPLSAETSETFQTLAKSMKIPWETAFREE